MEITKPNDLLVASYNNPEATTYDLMSADLTPDNTSLYKKEDYMNTKFVQDRFRDEKGNFDNAAFDNFYNKVQSQYRQMTDAKFLKQLDTIQYSPFDVTRPKDADTYKVEVEFGKDINPYKQKFSRTGINSIDDNDFSLRELAQQSKVYDPETQTWSDKSANDLGLLDKFFGDTLVYAQWDTDGVHKDIETGRIVNHKAGDWKVNDDGNLYLEKLGNREVYGKQVVNPTDMLTTDGSLANTFDVWDADSREKSVLKTSAKIAFDIAPFLIPGVGQAYGGIRAAVGLASVLPTFYKSLEGMLLGDTDTGSRRLATAAENYMAKFSQNSISDEAQGSLFNYEQMSSMVSSIFSQIYEQRAAASLSMLIKNPAINKWEGKAAEVAKEMTEKLGSDLVKGKIDYNTFEEAYEIAKKKIPELQSVIKEQGKLAKSLSLGYMALTSTADIYGQAIQGGYDRRTAGFAALASAAGQYGIMMNNRMGDWFLDKSTGYSLETSRALTRKSVLPLMDAAKEASEEFAQNAAKGKVAFGKVFSKIKDNFEKNFLSPSVVGEAMWKNAYVEGVEEVTEQMVQDATKGIVDTMSYLGLTKKQGSFGGIDVVFSKAGLENYLANFVGGLLGGAMFEFNRIKIEPFLSGNSLLEENTKTALYDNIANGRKEELIAAIKAQKSKFGNNYIGLVKEDGSFDLTPDGKMSQADFIANKAIEVVEALDGILNSQDLGNSDSDIVSKAIRDSIIIKALSDKKGDKNVGIEGLILSDYKEKAEKVMKLTEEINSLSAKPEENKEAISRLEEERKLYKDQINEILLGEAAEKYYNRITFYLNKNISENWIVIDKDTFSKHKYEKSYKSLPEKGLGVTKERVDKEYKEYIDAKDVEKELGVATDAYLEFERTLNPAIAEYIKSGYSNEVSKTFKNLLNNELTKDLFDTEGEEGLQNIIRFLEIARLTESQPGNTKVMPWEAIYTKIGEKLQSSSGFKVLNKNNVITMPDGTEIKVEEAAKNILHNVISILPPGQFSYNVLSEAFRQEKDRVNQEIRVAKKDILEPLEQKLAETQDPEERQALIEKIGKHLITATLDPYEATQEFQEKLEAASLLIQQKYSSKSTVNPDGTVSTTEGLSQEDFENFMKNPALKALPLISDKIPFAQLIKVLQDNAKLLGLDLSLEKDLADFTEDLTNSKDLTPEQVQSILSTGLYIGKSRTVKKLLKQFLNTLESTKGIINGAILENAKKWNIYKAYSDEVDQAKKDLITNSPALFKVTDLMMEQLLHELTVNKTLDGEVIRLVKDMTRRYLSPILSTSSTFGLTTEDVFDISSRKPAELGSIQSQFSQLTNMFSDENFDFENEFPNYIDELITNLETSKAPKKFIEIAKTIQDITDGDGDEDSKMTQIKNLIFDFNKTIEEIIRSKSTLEKVNEVFNAASNTKKIISNPLYDLLRQINLSLDSENTAKDTSIFDILETEQMKLNTASDLTTYFSNGVNVRDLDQAINAVKLAQSVVKAMSTTEVSFADAYGFIASRKNFIKANGLTSDSSSLETITSDMAQLMSEDLERISVKLKFLRDLAKYNSGMISREQKIIRTKVTDILVNKWKALSLKDLKFKEKPLIPDLEDILESSQTNEQKVYAIENAFHENLKQYSQEEQLQIAKLLATEYSYTNTLESLYSKNGSDEITRDIKDVSNNDMLLYLISNMAISSKDFNIKLKSAFKNGFDKAPFYTQELGLRIMLASLVHKELFADVVKTLSPIEGNISDKEKVQTHDTSLITYVLGNAGTGKTTVMYKMLITMLLDSNPSLNIWFSGPELEQAEKLMKDSTSGLDQEKIDSQNLSKSLLFEKLGIKELVDNIEKDKKVEIRKSGSTIYINSESTVLFKDEPEIELKTDLPDLILLDEVSHYKAFELDLINRVVKKAGENGKTIKVFAAGDQFQEGADFGEGSNSINYNIDRVSGIFVPQLFLTIRAQNNQKRDNNEVLVNFVRRINRIWENHQESNNQVFNTILHDGISLKYHHKINEDFNGDYLTNKIPDDVLLTIGNNIKADPTKTLGILALDGVLPEELKLKLERLSIPEAVNGKGGYVVVSPKKVQGKEFDYFIFDLSQTKRKSVFDTLKAFYTYSSRAKNGTIIVNDGNITFSDRPIIFTQKEEGYTEALSPLNETEIAKLRDERNAELTSLIGDNATAAFNFSFNSTKELENATNLEEGEIATEKEEIDSIVYNAENESNQIKFSQREAEKKNKNSVNTLIHTFYHDLGVKEEISGDEIKLTLKPNAPYNYIISALFDGKQEKTLKLNAYNTFKNVIVKEKFNVLKNKQVSSEFVRAIFGNQTKLSEVKQSLAIIADIYNDTYNNPKHLKYDDENQHLNNGEKYLNLVMKLTYEGKDYVLHLGTFPKLETIAKYYTENHTIFTSYKDLLRESEIGKYIDITPERFEIITSTRLYTGSNRKKGDPTVVAKKKSTLKEIKDLPGVKFYNTSLKEVTEPVISFFPKNPDAYKKLMKATTFGEPMSEEQLEASFQARKGKPYIAISFIGGDNQIQFVTLHSERRSWKEIENIIYGNSATGQSSLIKKFIEGGKDKRAENLAISTSLFSANDVVDLWIALAKHDGGKLYKDLLESGQNWLNEILSNKAAGVSKETIQMLFGKSSRELDYTVLDLITYKDAGAAMVYQKIIDLIKANPKATSAEIKRDLLPTLRNPNTKFWASRFWNIFKLREQLANARNPFSKTLDEQFLKTITDIIEFWEKSKPEGLYYNVPIVSENNIISVSTSDKNSLESNLYTNLEPEGPHLLLDLNGIGTISVDSTAIKENFLKTIEDSEVLLKIAKELKVKGVTKNVSNSVIRGKIAEQSDLSLDKLKLIVEKVQAENDQEKIRAVLLKEKVEELSTIKFNGKVIMTALSSDSFDDVTEKIAKSLIIKDILVNPNSKYKLTELRPLSTTQLSNILNELSGDKGSLEILRQNLSNIKLGKEDQAIGTIVDTLQDILDSHEDIAHRLHDNLVKLYGDENFAKELKDMIFSSNDFLGLVKKLAIEELIDDDDLDLLIEEGCK